GWPPAVDSVIRWFQVVKHAALLPTQFAGHSGRYQYHAAAGFGVRLADHFCDYDPLAGAGDEPEPADWRQTGQPETGKTGYSHGRGGDTGKLHADPALDEPGPDHDEIDDRAPHNPEAGGRYSRR